jgi:ParB family chromosome partitioning protein
VAGPDGTDAPGATVRKLRPPGLLELEELFSQYLDTRVNVTMGPRHGRIAIEFADLEDLERIYRTITGEVSDED